MLRDVWKRARPWIERGAILLLFAFLGRYAYLRWQEVKDVELSLSLPHMAVAVFLLLFFYLTLSRTWQRILRMIDAWPEGTSYSALFRAFLMAFVARYLPAGNVLTIGGRVELLHRLGGSRSRALESVYYEQLYLTVGAFGLGLLAYAVAGKVLLPSTWWGAVAWLVAVVALIGTIAVASGAEIALRIAVRVFSIERLNHLGTKLYPANKLELVGRFLIINVLQGGTAFFFLWGVFPSLSLDLPTILLVIASYPMSRFIGQAAAVIPGGLGIREGAYAFILGALMPVQPVLVSAGLLRLSSVLLEFFLLGITSVWEKGGELRSFGAQQIEETNHDA